MDVNDFEQVKEYLTGRYVTYKIKTRRGSRTEIGDPFVDYNDPKSVVITTEVEDGK